MSGHGFNELAKCRSGQMLCNPRDWPIGKSLLKYGEYSYGEVEIFKKLLSKDMLVIDAGANIGVHTLEMSRLASYVLAFEPQRIAFQTMCANLMLNECANVRAINAALGDKDGYILVPVRDQYAENNFGGVRLEGVTDGESTELMRLDKIGFNRLDFIKADLEGMEPAMLRGAERTIARHRPTMYLEVDHVVGKETIRLMLDLKYECWWHFPRLFNPGNFNGDHENMFMVDNCDVSSVNMVCFPAEKNAVVTNMRKILTPDDEGMEFDNRMLREAALV